MNYAEIKTTDIANGEGVRTSLFVSGCRHHCKNCFNPETWNFNYGENFNEATQNEIIEKSQPYYINGLTLLGGEPMEIVNQKGLLEFVKKFKQVYPNKTIWCYTGFLIDDIMNYNFPYDKNEFLQPLTNSARCHCEITKEFLSYIDILVDGEFVNDLKDITLRFKGSKNQRIIDVKQTLKQNKIILSEYNNKK